MTNFQSVRPEYTKNIACTVENCVYHQANNCCGASKIQVGPVNSCAGTAENTFCQTFKSIS